MEAKTLNVTDTADAKAKISDIEVVGNPDVWQLICKASSKSQGWMKSTKAIVVDGGFVLQVSTQTREGVAEAVTFVPSENPNFDTARMKKKTPA